jgi:predicted regulator of amino acid metabolism with ACT domain
VLTIYVESPENAGILSEVTSIIAGYGISIRQVLAEDVEIYEEPCLKVITHEPLPGRVIETLTAIKGVSRVVIEK